MQSLSQSADRAQSKIIAYQTTHVQMACAAERVAAMVAEHCFTAEEGIEALTQFAKQYRARLAAIDGQAVPS
jgi:hypothetical protein